MLLIQGAGYIGNFRRNAIINFKFSTHDSNGASVAYTGGTIEVYKDDNTTETAVGVTVSAAFDSIVGVHNVKIDTSADSFYESEAEYTVVMTTSTIDTQSVSHTLASFSINKRAT